MKKSRITGLLMAGIVATSIGFTACGGGKNAHYDADGNKVTDTSKILEIALWNSGLGRQWLDDLTEAFKEKNKGIAVSIIASGSQDTFYNTITSGAKANSFDLYFTYGPAYRKYFEGQYKNGNYLESLDDVYGATPIGEDKTIAEKFPSYMLEEFKVNDHYYSGIWQASANGLLYNHTEFAAHEAWKMNTATGLPNTTNQLKALSQTIMDTTREGSTEKYTPFLHVPGYPEYMWGAWWAQYEGVEKYGKFWDEEYYSYFADMYENGWDTSESVIYVQKGVNKALEAFYDIIAPEGRTMPGSNDTSTGAFSILQTNFLQGEAMMMVNGGWLETEMSKNQSGEQVKDRDVRFMKMPVLSSIVETLEDNYMTDTQLSQVIDYIDGGETGECPITISDNDLARIREARQVTYTSGLEITTQIPSYAEGKGLAKEFLKFLYSNEGAEIYIKSTKQVPPWYTGDVDKIDTSNWSTFSKSHLELQKNATYIYKSFEHPISYQAGRINPFDASNDPAVKFTSEGASRQTVSQFIVNNINILKGHWVQMRTSMGIKD
ncbi:MAG: hypothetical protein IJX87_03210 [Clostridia bacterium]|nr:hypothetical protein [Clostridia bacterium]